jgi:predicted MPP superfamily phosphohydrolase
MIDRRQFLIGGVALPLIGLGLGAYAVVVEPNFILNITRYRLTPKDWPPGLRLRFAAISDIHAGEPFMSAARIGRIAQAVNALAPDAILLLGDYNAGHRFIRRAVTSQQIGEALSALRAPLGVFAVLGNHDWWHGDLLGRPNDGTTGIRRALTQAGIRVLENDAVPLSKDGEKFWLLGLGDQLVRFWGHAGDEDKIGVDDLEGTLNKVTDSAPIVMMAHEPMIFRDVPNRIALTLSGHTHGGQINLPLLGPVVGQLRFGRSLVYGHSQVEDRHIIVSGGLGESVAPVRFLRPPEILEITLGGGEES